MRRELEFEDTFEGDVLDPSRWLPYYLPDWSSRERSAARGTCTAASVDHDAPP